MEFEDLDQEQINSSGEQKTHQIDILEHSLT